MTTGGNDVPEWLKTPQDYTPTGKSDRFVTKSILSVSGVLARFRLDDGKSWALSPQAPLKLLGTLVVVVLVSLSRNFFFVLAVLALLVLRMTLLERKALARVCATSLATATLTFLLMLPAALLGQPQSALTLAAKSLVSVGLTMTAALTTPMGELTGGLRALGLPTVAILTIELALSAIVRLGQTCLEVLDALMLRSVGTNRHKQASMGGIGGVVLLKASRTANDTFDAMRCRGFDGEYHSGNRRWRIGIADLAWIGLIVTLVALFTYTQGLV